MKRNKILKTFTDADLDAAAKAVHEDKVYGAEEALIKACFVKYPENTSRELVAMKIGLIDVTNSTNISRYKSRISVPDIVDILLEIKDFDRRLSEGDPSLVTEIAVATKTRHDINLFSFATKYCCYHNLHVYGGDAYCIYDNILHDNIPDYIAGISKQRLDYIRMSCYFPQYLEVIDTILANNNITTDHKRRKFDNLLWYYNR